MTWTLILMVFWGDMPTTQVVSPFQTEEQCTTAAKTVTADFRKEWNRIGAVVASCVRQ